MTTHSLHQARAGLSSLFDKALSGQPQRITRYGKDTVVMVSEADWLTRAKPEPANTLGSLLAGHGRRRSGTWEVAQPFSQKRRLGADFD